jgi:protoporphyrinogen oxidase
MGQQETIAILGAGVAGLSAGCAARSLGLPFRVFERTGQAGGNCVTFSQDGFRFDSGAHRVHDRDAQATRQLQRLLGSSLRRIHVPSQIYYREKFITFPFKVGDLAEKLGWPFLLRSAGEVLLSHMRREKATADFASAEERKYGRTLAGLFLLNYSEKLWGVPCEQLAVEAAGNRLQGLKLTTFLREALLPGSASARHLEGPFYYPDGGIGAVSDSLASACGAMNISTNADINRVSHDGRRIRTVEAGSGESFACSAILSTIPLDRFLRLLAPPPPPEVLAAAAALRFRQLALVALFINRELVTRAATIYFPDPGVPFTRVCEPRNRSVLMAPPETTSLVAEIPYSPGDPYECMDDERLSAMVRSHLVRSGLIAERDVIASSVRRLADAYPVLEKGVEEKRRVIFSYLGRFANLRAIGRCGTFSYLHIHQLLPRSAQAVKELQETVL